MRALTGEERDALSAACTGIDPDRVHLHRAPGDLLRGLVLFLSRGRAVTLGRHVFLPEARASDLALLAHELTHCRQYEEWGFFRYYRRGVLEQARHLLSRFGAAADPYDWRRGPPRRVEEYGMEQQGQLVEDAYRGDPTARAIAAANWSTSSSVVSHDAIHRTSDRRSSHT